MDLQKVTIESNTIVEPTEIKDQLPSSRTAIAAMAGGVMYALIRHGTWFKF
jgi:hypothetical protein